MSELIVYLLDRRVGRLIRKDNGNLQFRYDENYDGPVVSQALPIRREAHPHAVCHAVFGGLLLEGEARETIARNLGVSVTSDYGLLEELGGDCAGAITLLGSDAQLSGKPATQPLDDDQLEQLLRELPRRPLGADPEHGIRMSLAGSQPKLPVVIEENGSIALPLNAATPSTHIIKPETERFPGLVDNEAFCMDLASAIGLAAAKVEKRTTPSGLRYLLVERYDRDLTAEPVRRLHQEDFCQALAHPAERKYQADGGPTVLAVVELIRSCSAVPAHDLPALWRTLILNWLIGNCDAHSKNFSLLYDGTAPSLAPLYDLVSTTVYPELTTRLAMTLDGARQIEQVDAAALMQLATEAGYSLRFAREATVSVIESVPVEADRLAATARHHNGMVERLVADIHKRSA